LFYNERINFMKRTSRIFTLLLSIGFLLAAWPAIGYAQPVADEPVIVADFGETGITWSAPQGTAGFVLVVSGPNGYRFERNFDGATRPTFQTVDPSGLPLADGLYQYELRPIHNNMLQSRSGGDDGRDAAALRELAARQPQSSLNLATQSGAFTVQNGTILDPNAVEEADASGQPQQNASPNEVAAPGDNVIADDQIVQGSLCVGFDCVNNESFGFDTIRLKENNTRIGFDDTSVGAFPANDWQLTANDSASGGANKFSIEDITGAKVPFTVIAGAPTNSLYIDSSGRVGLRTSTPVLDLHISTGNTPATRLEQTATSGFTAQTWDVAGNEANFFVRDVTNGSRLSFRIRPGAPTSSIDIAASGNVGVGTASPTASLHVRRTDGTAQVLVEEASGTGALRTLLHLKNNGNVALKLERATASSPAVWNIGTSGLNLAYFADGAGVTASRLAQNGNLTIAGTLTTGGPICAGGCRQQRDAFVQSALLLDKLAGVPMINWTTSSISEDPDTTEIVTALHLSPEMETFYEVYGLGVDNQSIAPLDVATVALASAQALKETVDAQSAQIAALEAQLAAVEERLQRLEQMAHTHVYLPEVSADQ
jgi:hypothetical protein